MASSRRSVPGSRAKRTPARYASTLCWRSVGYVATVLKGGVPGPRPRTPPGSRRRARRRSVPRAPRSAPRARRPPRARAPPSGAARRPPPAPPRARRATQRSRGRRFLSRHGAEDPVHEPRRVEAAELLGRLHRLVYRHLGGHVRPVEQLVQPHAQDVALERRDAVERPAHGMTLDEGVELLPLAAHAGDQLAREVGLWK